MAEPRTQAASMQGACQEGEVGNQGEGGVVQQAKRNGGTRNKAHDSHVE